MKNNRLWTKSFSLLFQSQFVSAIGDIFYEIALGFWVFQTTKSTSIMGALMAASSLPKVLILPFGGVATDRYSRKLILVLSDLIRGVFVLFIGIAAIFGFLEIWMVFVAGLVLSFCSGFFNPAVSSVLPDIVPKDKLVKANSVFSLIQLSYIVGSSGGGFLYKILGAPFMFLINGLSYLISGLLTIFLKVPKIQFKSEKKHFMIDLKDGFRFIWKMKQLRFILILSSGLYFFSSIAVVLFLPLFETENYGPIGYGISLSTLAFGALFGAGLISFIHIKHSNRFKIFFISSITCSIGFILLSLTTNLYIMLIYFFICGITLAIVNVFFQTVLQIAIPQNMRGKVFSLVSMTSNSLVPIAMGIGGILGDIFPIRKIILCCFVIIFSIVFPSLFSKAFRKFMNFDPEKNSCEEFFH